MTRKQVALITGITGQDGSYLAEFLLDQDYDVIGLVRRSTHYHHENIAHLAGKIILEHGDLIDANTIEHIIATYQPTEVYNLAAQSVPADSWHQPIVTAEITALGPVRIMEALRKHQAEARFYQATSREIYGGVPQEVIDENSPFLANNPYGVAKLYAHLMVESILP
jgi:GDPmannose 4,6-dehydratase